VKHVLTYASVLKKGSHDEVGSFVFAGVLSSRHEKPDPEPDSEPEEPDHEPDLETNEPEPYSEISDWPEDPDFGRVHPPDSFVDAAKVDLRGFFVKESESVFYQRQLQVIFEQKYFHWITVRALEELVQEGAIAREVLPLPDTGIITFYRAIRYRYWKRDADEVVKLVCRFSESSFTYALGAHGETMFDAVLPTIGFMPKGRKVRSFRGVDWTESNHDLDRVFERDGVPYGVEIKNTLSYIERRELEIKVRMCQRLALKPLFILRFAPKSYVQFVKENGGFTLIFKYQLYPFGQKAFADEVRARLRLPTDSPARIEDGTVKRLLDWHLRQVKRGG